MAKWILYQNARQNLTLLYRNLINGTTFCCGELRSDTPALMIVEWIIKQSAAQPGDIIQLADMNVLQILPSQAQA
jgi:hypothetical protein